MDGQLKSLIGEIGTEFNRLLKIAAANPQLADVPFAFGNLAKNENDAPPKIVWGSPSGQFDPGKGIGGTRSPAVGNAPGSPPIATIVPRLVIWIWAVDDVACWDLFRSLGPAIRNKCGGPNTRWREYQEPTDSDGHWMDFGSVLVLTLDLDIELVGQVPNERVERAVLRHTHNVSLLNTTGDSGSNPLP